MDRLSGSNATIDIDGISDIFRNTETSTPKESSQTQLISDETTFLISQIILFGFSPMIAIVGVVLNIFSVIVLYKNGLKKCSNILLFSLAIMDMSFLIGLNNVPGLLYTMQGGGRFLYSESVSYFLFVSYLFLVIFDYGIGLATLCVPVLITFERLVAVYAPLKFGQIITPTRTLLAVLANVTFWIGLIAYTCFWYEFQYILDESLNRTAGIIAKSELFYRDFPGIPMFEKIFFSVKAPPIVTGIGCSAILFKIKMATKKRSEMTSSKTASTSKTTKMLLAVCFGYFMTCAILAIPTYLPEELGSYSLTTNRPTNAAVITYRVISRVTSINSSWNFFVYVGFNKNFRDTFKMIMTKGCCAANKT